MTDTPPMSAEDRAMKALDEFFAVAEYDEWIDPPGAAKAALEALSSEGLAVVAREDRLTPVEARALLALLESKLTIDSPPVQKGESTARPKLRRLSGADQDG